jgi:hypothetical protein
MSTIKVTNVQTTNIQNALGTASISADKVTGGGYYVRQVQAQADTTSYTFSTAWSLGPAFAGISNCLPNSLIQIEYHMPCRNDSTGWGGLYIEPQVQFGGAQTQYVASSWYSLGSSGYDGAVMNSGSADIGSYYNSVLLTPAITNTYSIAMRFYGRAYDGTAYINTNHDVNVVSGTATSLTGTNFNQHFSKIIISELAPIV